MQPDRGVVHRPVPRVGRVDELRIEPVAQAVQPGLDGAQVGKGGLQRMDAIGEPDRIPAMAQQQGEDQRQRPEVSDMRPQERGGNSHGASA